MAVPFDAHNNFAYSTVATAPSPASSGTSLIVAAGTGALFPTPPFNAVVWPAGAQPLTTNSEIVRVTGISVDTLTIARQTTTEGVNQTRSIIIGDQIDAGVTQYMISEVENYTNPIGSINAYAGRTAPAGWLLCYGQAVSQSTYANLFAAICPNLGAVTITNASPAVVTLSGHGFVTGDEVYFNGSGTINTGLSQNTNYFVIVINSSTFNLATTLANAIAGTKINTTGALSGTINCYAQPYGGANATTFNLPDLRGRSASGADAMGGTAANRLTNSSYGAQGTYGNLGAAGGEQAHTQVTNELVSHTHGLNVWNSGSGGGGAPLSSNNTNAAGAQTDNATGGGSAMNVTSPTQIVNYIIKY